MRHVCGVRGRTPSPFTPQKSEELTWTKGTRLIARTRSRRHMRSSELWISATARPELIVQACLLKLTSEGLKACGAESGSPMSSSSGSSPDCAGSALVAAPPEGARLDAVEDAGAAAVGALGAGVGAGAGGLDDDDAFSASALNLSNIPANFFFSFLSCSLNFCFSACSSRIASRFSGCARVAGRGTGCALLPAATRGVRA